MTQTELAIMKIAIDSSKSKSQIIWDIIDTDIKSKEKELMKIGNDYYYNDNDITSKVYETGENKGKLRGYNTPNAFMKQMIDEKVGVSIGNEPKIVTETKNADVLLEDFKNEINMQKLHKTLSALEVECSNKGVEWLLPKITNGKFDFMIVDALEIVPIFKLGMERSYENLESVLRYYYIVDTNVKTGRKEYLFMVEWYYKDRVEVYQQKVGSQDFVLVEDRGHILEYNENGEVINSYNWGRIPLIPFPNNRTWIPDIKWVKELIDKADDLVSDDRAEQNKSVAWLWNFINFGGTQKDFEMQLRNIKEHNAIFSNSLMGSNGESKVDIISVDLKTESRKLSYEWTEKSIYKFGQATNIDIDKFGANPSGVALKIMYTPVLLKVQKMEVEHKESFDVLIEFFKEFKKMFGGKNYGEERLNIEYNHMLVENEKENADILQEKVQTAINTLGVTTKETTLKALPDEILPDELIEEELQKLEQENPPI